MNDLKNTTVIIPAAGMATRLRPLSSSVSKAMVSVNGKPAIAYILEQLKECNDIRVVVGEHNSDLVSYLKRVHRHVNIYYQRSPKGPLHAVWSAFKREDTDSSNSAVIWLGDSIILKPSFSKISESIKNSERGGCINSSASVTCGVVPDYSRWCLCNNEGTGLFDKPTDDPGTRLALAGLYEFSSLSELKKATDVIISSEVIVRGEFQISQALEKFLPLEVVITNEWYDVGDLPSLYESKARLLTRNSRPDNQIIVNIDEGSITKKGLRCSNEIQWYVEASKNPNVIPYIPQLYSYSIGLVNSYKISYVPGNTVQEIFAFEDLKTDAVEYTMKRIMAAYSKLIGQLDVIRPDLNPYMLCGKNLDRVKDYSNEYSFVNEDELKEYRSFVYRNQAHKFHAANVIHGDFHAGNILFDYHTGMVKFIDPRGLWEYSESDKKVMTSGLIEYDLAKMYQSFYCDYLWIKTDSEVNQSVKETAIKVLDDWCFTNGLNPDIIKNYSVILLGSILDFHKDRPDHQKKIWRKTFDLVCA